MQYENHGYDLQEGEKYGANLTRHGHAEEYAEYVERQQRHYSLGYCQRYYGAELVGTTPEHITATVSYAESHEEREHKRRHDAHHRRHGHLKPRRHRRTVFDSHKRRVGTYQSGE